LIDKVPIAWRRKSLLQKQLNVKIGFVWWEEYELVLTGKPEKWEEAKNVVELLEAT
jgi:thiamine monophosphate kinase